MASRPSRRAAALRPGAKRGRERAIPLIITLLALILIWWVAALLLNAGRAMGPLEQGAVAGRVADLVLASWSVDDPLLPFPDQVARDLWSRIALIAPDDPQSLIRASALTLGPALAGFLLGSGVGLLLAVAIFHSPTLDRAVTPWLKASRSIPLLILAPVIIMASAAHGFTGFWPKTLIAAGLAAPPVGIGMLRGLCAPPTLHLDLMRSYSASALQIFIKLRLPSTLPFLFPSLRIALILAWAGSLAAELRTGEGLGAHLLFGSYFGQMTRLWATFFMAALLAILLVSAVTALERLVAARQGRAS